MGLVTAIIVTAVVTLLRYTRRARLYIIGGMFMSVGIATVHGNITHKAKGDSKDIKGCDYKKNTCFVVFGGDDVCLWEERGVIFIGYKVGMAYRSFSKRAFLRILGKLHTAFYTVHIFPPILHYFLQWGGFQGLLAPHKRHAQDGAP